MRFTDPAKNIAKLGLTDGMMVADFGAGTGVYTMAVADKVGSRGAVYAVDVQQDLLSKIKNQAIENKYEHVDTLWADIDEVNGVNLKDELLDAVILSNTLFQLEKKENTVGEIKRVLKKGGKLLLIDWSEAFGGIGPHPVCVVTKESAKNLFESAEFSVDDDFDAGAHHYGFIFKKQ
ncbi:MAG: class I SAM-dependent methyltransferase [Candidatus Pacebacteria bacterium]|jgi:ubiquinone/menaquinone biosynthesis C-methylase UbiE|nr:class I SAM-dependent methyltransferase [Candidatus Paceibacterota bacterium]|tara:strand:+ start:310 stop:840 length:531 start_codon:yes stop_codon:yes gene_type:complete